MPISSILYIMHRKWPFVSLTKLFLKIYFFSFFFLFSFIFYGHKALSFRIYDVILKISREQFLPFPRFWSDTHFSLMEKKNIWAQKAFLYFRDILDINMTFEIGIGAQIHFLYVYFLHQAAFIVVFIINTTYILYFFLS